MLEKDSTYDATCDFCSNHQETGEEDFRLAVAEIQRKGWKVFKQSSSWHHKCPACQEAEREKYRENARRMQMAMLGESEE